MKIRKVITWSVFLIFIFSFPAIRSATEWLENENIQILFEEAQVEGTFVLYDGHQDLFIGYNSKRAHERFLPASTFKIANTLIGLTVGAIKDVDYILPYGGKKQPFPQWEKNMSLREAIAISNVPIYQELARRIGLEKMGENIKKLGYGNQNIGEVVDLFWLSGPLEISPIEQVQFLEKLAMGKLPFPESAQTAVREITLLENGTDWELHGKTGLILDTNPGIGWWIGWVKKQNNIYPFALNLRIQKTEDKDKRVPLGKAALKTLSLI